MTFPADPAEPPEWADADTWAVLRHDEPHTSAFWTVTLSCAHVTEVPVSDLGFWAEQPDAQPPREREHTQRMLAEGWPSPSPEHLCYTCPRARTIVACQRIGWLVPRTRAPKLAKPPSRASLEQQLRHAEAQADELRRQLAQWHAPAKQRDG